MNYQKIECEEYNIYFIKSKRCHTIDVCVCFTENVNKKIITYRNVLANIMAYETKRYDTNKKLTRECQNNYSSVPVVMTARLGNYFKTKFIISITNSKYIDNKILGSIKILKETILNPKVLHNEFNAENLDLVKLELANEKQSILENPINYANIKMYEKMDKEENYTLTNYVDLKILKQINGKNLYQSYREMLKESKIDIFIVGNIIKQEDIVTFIKKEFVFHNQFQKLEDVLYVHKVRRINPQIIKEKKEYQQSKLSIACKCFNLTYYENRYVLSVFDALIGTGMSSMLMQYAREEKSLCYFVDSYSHKLDNIVILNSAIKKENFYLMIDIIKEVFQKVQDGKFKEHDLQVAKKGLLLSLDTIEESNINLMELVYGIELTNGEDIKKRKEMIKKVTKKDLMNIVKKISIDTIFFLEGDL